MFGFSASQKIEVVVLVATVVLYFCGLTYTQQNAWLFLFSVALLCLIVDMLFMKDTTFDYEPHYENWQKKQEADA